MENYCKYRSIKYLNNSDIDNRLKHLYKGVCYLLGNSGSTPVVPDSTVDFSVNADPNTGGTTFSPNTPNLTTVIYVSTINGSQWTSNGTTYTLYVAPYWAKTGNSGTNPTTHFLGTTDNIGLKFRTNNVQSGYIDRITGSTSFGYQSLLANAANNNTAFGNAVLRSNISGINNAGLANQALLSLTTGSANSAFGVSTLQSVTITNNNSGFGYGVLPLSTGSNNSGFGHSALSSNTTSSNNLGIGYTAGKYNTTISNQVFINSLDRTNYIGDQTASPIYIQQNATVANQKIYLNGLMNLSYVPTYTDNAAALLGGLVAGNIYKIDNSGTYTLAIVV